MLLGGPGTRFTVRKGKGRAPGPQGAAPQGPALAPPPCERREGAEQQTQLLAQQASQSSPAQGAEKRSPASWMKQGGARSRGLGLALVRGGVLVPRGWGGGLGSILRHRKGDGDPPPSPSSRGRTTARRTRLPLLDPLAASLLASYHSKGGVQGNISSPSSARAGVPDRGERQGAVPRARTTPRRSISSLQEQLLESPAPSCLCSRGSFPPSLLPSRSARHFHPQSPRRRWVRAG